MSRPRLTVDIDAMRRARSGAGLSQFALSRAVDVSPGAIGLIETGRLQPSVALLERIAVATNTPATELATIDQAGAA